MAQQPHERDRADLRDPTAATPPRETYGAPIARDAGLNPDVPPDGRSDTRDRSIASLLKELRDESATLIKQELALAKTEMGEKASTVGRNAAAVAIGATVLYMGALVLLLGATCALYFGLVAAGLSHFNAGWISFLAVGGVVALIGYALLQKGISTIKRQTPVPEKTVQSMKEDKRWLQNQATK